MHPSDKRKADRSETLRAIERFALNERLAPGISIVVVERALLCIDNMLDHRMVVHGEADISLGLGAIEGSALMMAGMHICRDSLCPIFPTQLWWRSSKATPSQAKRFLMGMEVPDPKKLDADECRENNDLVTMNERFDAQLAEAERCLWSVPVGERFAQLASSLRELIRIVPTVTASVTFHVLAPEDRGELVVHWCTNDEDCSRPSASILRAPPLSATGSAWKYRCGDGDVSRSLVEVRQR